MAARTRFEALVSSVTSARSKSWDSVFVHNRDLDYWRDDVIKEPYSKSSLVYVCISTTARAISQVPLVIHQIASNGSIEPVPVTNPWQKIINRPNPYMDRYSFLESIVGFLLLDGSVFVLPFPPTESVPSSLWVIRKSYMSKVLDKRTGQLSGWNYKPEGSDSNKGPSFFFPLNYVSWTYFWNPNDPYEGLSPIDAGKISIQTDYKAARFNQQFFDSGAIPGGILHTDQRLHESVFKRILHQFEDRHKGYKQGHRIALLEQGLKYSQTGLSQKDMDFLELRKYDRDTIFQIFGLKKSIVSVTEDTNYATSREQRKEWYTTTLIPIMKLIGSSFEFAFLERTNYGCTFDVSNIEALHETFKDKVDTAVDLAKIGYPLNVINKRLRLGMPDVPWGDEAFLPINMLPISQLGQQQVEGYSAPPKEEPEEEEEEEEKPKFLYGKTLEIEDNTEKRKEDIWDMIMRSSAHIEDKFYSKTKRLLFQMRQRSLELLLKERKTAEDLQTDTFPKEQSFLRAYTLAMTSEAIKAGVESFTMEVAVGISFDLSDPVAVNYLSMKQIKVTGLITTIKNQIQIELVEGMDKGESIQEIANRIRKVYNMAQTRARTIARTEVIGASNFGRNEALKRSGIGKKEWFTAMDERVRASHVRMHGMIIPVNQKWILPSGAILSHPGDFSGPASEVINCRCVELAKI